jgi:hypothetical protein
MRIFLTWSGPYSQRAAAAWHKWLPHVIQSADPYMSDEDIDKGKKWFLEIAAALEGCEFGIVFLTPDNLSEPWVHFEAGALSKSIDRSRVVPFLLDVRPASVAGPLSQFQMTKFTKQDVHRLVRDINGVAGDGKVQEGILSHAFEVFWDELKSELAQVIADIKASKLPPKPRERTDRELLEELLELSRAQMRSMSRSFHRSGRVLQLGGGVIEDLMLEELARVVSGSGLVTLNLDEAGKAVIGFSSPFRG